MTRPKYQVGHIEVRNLDEATQHEIFNSGFYYRGDTEPSDEHLLDAMEMIKRLQDTSRSLGLVSLRDVVEVRKRPRTYFGRYRKHETYPLDELERIQAEMLPEIHEQKDASK